MKHPQLLNFTRYCCGKATSHSPTVKTLDKGVPKRVFKWLEEVCTLLNPKSLYICKGNIEDREMLIEECICNGMLKQLMAHKNCFIARSDPEDSFVQEKNIYYCGFNKKEFVPRTCDDVPSQLGNFLTIKEADERISSNFKKAMKGRKMFVIPFMLGARSSNIQMLGVQITDSPITALLEIMMHRTGYEVLDALREHDELCFYKVVHAMGKPERIKKDTHWPCDPANAFLLQISDRNEVWSYGSNYGHNALLLSQATGKALASAKGAKESEQFLAEKMAVLGIQKVGEPDSKIYIGVMGPDGVGKSTMVSILTTRMPEYRVTLVSDELAWIKPNSDTNKVHAINPEIGVFSYVQGASWSRTPIIMTATTTNTIYINTGSTDCDCVFWDTIEAFPDIPVTDWLDTKWTKQKLAAHIGARFTTRLTQYVNLDRYWDCPAGVPLSAIMVGVRRSNGYPLVFETPWTTGVTLLGSLRTEVYDNTGNPFLIPSEMKVEPFGSKAFLGYNLGKYADQWFRLGNTKCLKLPKVFFFNAFRRDAEGRLVWPGYQENIRILDWVMKQSQSCEGGCPNPIGSYPSKEEFYMEGLCDPNVTFEELFSHDEKFWQSEIARVDYFYRQQLPLDTPSQVCTELEKLKNLYKCGGK